MKKIIENKNMIIGFAIGLVLGLGIMYLFMPTQIAKLSDGSDSIAVWNNNGGLSANELYGKLKQSADMGTVLELIDSKLLEEKYPYEKYKETTKQKAKELVEYYNENYQLDEEGFLDYYGFSDMETFIEYLILDTRRYDYFKDTVTASITEKEKKDYYKNEVFGDIGTKYVAVEIDDDSSKDEKLIKEIMTKVKNGASYDDIVNEYHDKEGFGYSNIGYVSYNSGMDTTYLNELKKLKDNSHSSKYIVSEVYGYTIVFRTKQKEKPTYEDIEDSIVNDIFNAKDFDDSTLFENTLIKMRKENGLTFTDTEFKKLYKEYIKSNKK